MNQRNPLFPIACVIALGVCGVQAAGVAALKEQVFHRDSSASAVVYSRIVDSRGPYLRLVCGSRNIEILRLNLVARIELPDAIPESIFEEHEIAPFRELLVDVRDFTTRYSRSASVLRRYSEALANHVSRFDAGEVRFEGAWISRSELLAIQDSRRRELEAGETAEVEKRVFEAFQRDKGLVLHDGKWTTSQQIRQQPAESPTELSDAMEPLWNGDLDGAKFAVKNLTALASRQTGAPKVRTERLLAAVRNLFLAESRVTQRIISAAADTHAAAIQDKNAKQWLVPNGFGTVHAEAARESRRKAMEIRRNSEDEIAARKQELLEQLREIDVVTQDFLKLRERRVAMILNAAARTVGGRHFAETEYRPVGLALF